MIRFKIFGIGRNFKPMVSRQSDLVVSWHKVLKSTSTILDPVLSPWSSHGLGFADADNGEEDEPGFSACEIYHGCCSFFLTLFEDLFWVFRHLRGIFASARESRFVLVRSWDYWMPLSLKTLVRLCLVNIYSHLQCCWGSLALGDTYPTAASYLEEVKKNFDCPNLGLWFFNLFWKRCVSIYTEGPNWRRKSGRITQQTFETLSSQLGLGIS